MWDIRDILGTHQRHIRDILTEVRRSDECSISFRCHDIRHTADILGTS